MISEHPVNHVNPVKIESDFKQAVSIEHGIAPHCPDGAISRPLTRRGSRSLIARTRAATGFFVDTGGRVGFFRRVRFADFANDLSTF